MKMCVKFNKNDKDGVCNYAREFQIEFNATVNYVQNIPHNT